MRTAKEYLEETYPIWAKLDDRDLAKIVVIDVAEEYAKEAWNEAIKSMLSKIEKRRIMIAETIDYWDVAVFELDWMERHLKSLLK